LGILDIYWGAKCRLWRSTYVYRG